MNQDIFVLSCDETTTNKSKQKTKGNILLFHVIENLNLAYDRKCRVTAKFVGTGEKSAE